MSDLPTGTYTPKRDIQVTYWPAPDVNGDGEDAWEDKYDNDGNYLGREPVEHDGQQVKHYLPPKGFTRVPTRDPGSDGATEAHVRDNGRGQVYRKPNGEAVGIKEGSALVEYPDGSHTLLTTGYAMRQFAKAHERVDGGVLDV